MLSRREFLLNAGCGIVAAQLGRLPLQTVLNMASPKSMRCINIVNFIRGVEPRFATDLLLPVQRQMELVKKHRFPTTWLLQYDALVSGKFVEFLKTNMPADHEVGFWFEMNEMHCRAAGVDWRGRPGFEWDHYPNVAFTIGYTKDERVKLADAAMAEFKKVWGRHPKSVASWNLDAFTMAHLTEKYGMDAYAVCRDQIATDGFTIWGAPIAGYYPSKSNCWSPALSKDRQIKTPVLRMLGQDPVYYYDEVWTMPDGGQEKFPDTMEPVWPSGKNTKFVANFLDMIESAPALGFSYLQMGQENSFPWDQQAEAYPKQMEALAELMKRGKVHVETMGDTGRRFKEAFKNTPAQAQVMVKDTYGKTAGAQASVWFQNRFYRADLHLKTDAVYLRDVTVYSDDVKQPFLDQPTKQSFVEQRMPAVMDGYHWSMHPGSLGDRTAGAYFQVGEKDLKPAGPAQVSEDGKSLVARVPVEGGGALVVRFAELRLNARLDGASGELVLAFEWDPAKTKFRSLLAELLSFADNGFEYRVKVLAGTAKATATGLTVQAGSGGIELELAQV